MLSSRLLRGICLFCVTCLFVALVSSSRSFAQPQSSGESFEALTKQAEEARDHDRVDDAVLLYRKALALRPTWAEGWWSLGTLEYDSNMYGTAADAFRHVLELKPEHGSAWVMLGLCQFELDDDDGSFESLEKGRALGVANEAQLYNVATYHIGVLQLRKKLFASALKTFQKLARNGVNTDEVALGLAMALLMVQPSALPSENTAGRAVALGIGRAEALSAAKKFEQARQAYLSLLQQNPNYPGLHFAFGLFLTGSEPEEAVKQMQAELGINPKHVVALLQMSALLLDEDPAKALEFAKNAVEINPRPPFGHYMLGRCYLKVGSAESALAELELARRDMPNEPQIYFALGNTYAKLGKKQEAAQARADFLRLQDQEQEQNRAAPGMYGEDTQVVLPEKALAH